MPRDEGGARRDDVRPLHAPRYLPITDYGLVGDGRSAALVSSHGSVDWWCPERFDAESVFARVLDHDAGGHFAIGLPVRHKRTFGYLEDTNVLESRLVTSDADVRVLTFMARAEASASAPRMVRIVECLEGEVDVTVELAPRFDYAREEARVSRAPGGILAEGARDALFLTTDLPLATRGASAAATVRLSKGDRRALHLAHAAPGSARAIDGDAMARAEADLDGEVARWREWIARCAYRGPHEGLVRRSLLALKLLQFEPTGAFVAAPTCSLPEGSGGWRNWDYRYSWLRDGSFIVMAFETMGFPEEAERFREWIAAIVRRDAPDRLQMLYRVDGSRDLRETQLDHLEGYRGSRPVRVGNEAAEQHQLDTYGEIMMCFHRARDVFDGPHAEETWRGVHALVEWVADHWDEPDSGIWEMRGRHRQYVYSKAMAWLALDHGLSIARDNGFDAPVARWERAARRVREFALAEGYRDGFGSFTQATDRADADASNLLLPILGFISPDDPRMRATARRTRAELDAHGLLQRYTVDDEMPGNEGAFLATNYWLAAVLAAQGDADAARAAFDAATRVASPLLLLPEMADALTREPLGNHPQALTHLSLLLAADALENPAGWRTRQPIEDARAGARRPSLRSGGA